MTKFLPPIFADAARLLLMGAALLGSIFSAEATLVYDGFEGYTTGATLHGANGGTGWTSPYTIGASQQSLVTAASGGLSYSGGSIVINGGSSSASLKNLANNNDLLVRQFTPIVGASEVWFSLVYKPVANVDGNDFVQFWIGDDNDREKSVLLAISLPRT